MSGIVAIASNAIAAYQRALGTTSNNIANVATDGYSRQEVALQANPMIRVGSLYMGSGVMVDYIKRNYNAFIESNLRNSGSDLASQEPMVNYANRVVDVLGGQTMGLTSALDQFFSSARSLSADPASSVLRSSFVRDAQGVASRFQELSSQLDLLQEETAQILKGAVEQINTLTDQLARVNQQLAGQRTEAAQAPELLDQRDRLLKTLSGFTRITTRFETNGTVSVSLGPLSTADIVVEGNKSLQIGINFNPAAPEKVSLVLDPYGKPSTLSGITSGQLAGLMAFREQVLGSTRAALDKLASTFATEVNTVHQGGIDGYGNTAGALFKFDPSAATAAGGLQVAFDDPLKVSAAAQFRVIEDANNAGNADATLVYAPATQAAGPPDLLLALVNNDHPSAANKPFNVSGSLPLGVASIANGMQDVSIFLNSMGDGQQLQILTRDGRHILGAAMDAAQLISPDNGFAAGATYSSAYLNQRGSQELNPGYKGMSVFYGAQADVRMEQMYDSKGLPTTPTPLPALLQGTRMAMADDTTGIAALTLNGVALGALPALRVGYTTLQAGDIAEWITSKAKDGITATASNEIRVTDAQLKLKQPLSINGVLITPDQETGGFSSKDALIAAINAKTVAMGSGKGVSASKAADGTLVLTNVNGEQGNDITINSGLPPPVDNALGLTAGTFTGSVSLSRPLSIDTETGKWDGSATPIELGFGSSSPIAVFENGTNEITETATLTFKDLAAGASVTVGGLTYTSTAGNTAAQVAAAFASLTSGMLYTNSTLTSRASTLNGGYTGAFTTGYTTGTVSGVGVVATSVEAFTNVPAIVISSNGSTGTPADLAKLGFRTGAYIKGAVKDDLLVFVTGAGSASVSASYAGAPVDAKQSLRGQEMKVRFSNGDTSRGESSADLYYTITDSNTTTEVARRKFDRNTLEPGVQYQGLKLSFSSPPLADDVFTLDNNRDGTGNNENMLALAALEQKAMVGNKTLSGAYLDHVNEMGNIARQASIAKTALKVVNDQATVARNAIAGVNLDQEATDLIRFQQAYQAAAKVLQIAGTLFDNVLQIR